MYGTVRVYSGNGGLAEQLAENESEVKELLNGIDGFKAYYLIKTDGGTASISVYETEGGADESNQAAAAWIKERLPNLEVPAPQILAGEVVIDA